ncbi:helix-turn-helix transcriptional regulator [Kribbella ginsengisoli]|uniref:HTH cro/C1-type domain-containing protein n=1 Tax=Kribbella ginsengisoli TaxID=363865 RepID=A0ABP6Y5D4_9ACTN
MVTVVASWTGATASALRLALRLTQEELASRIGGMSPRGVGRWEKEPDMSPTMVSQRDLDYLLREATEDEKARFALLLQDLEKPTRPSGSVTMPQQERAEKLLIPLQPPRGTATKPTSETLTWLEQNLRNQYTADNLLGPRALMPLMTSYVDTIEQMQQNASGAVLDRLLRVGASYAEFTGWLHQDAGDLRGATTWATRALEWAQGGMDDRMTSFVMMRRAAAALTARHGPYAVRFAQAAQRFNSPETGRIRVIAAVTEAHGHAIAGDGGESDRALDTAAGLLEQYNEEILDGDPTADRYCELGLYTKIARAKCVLELGRAGDAVDAFTIVLDSLPRDYHRDRGQYLGSLARAHILAEQPELAAAAAQEAYSIAIATGSTRTLADLRRTMPSGLARWANIPEVEKFCAMLAAVEPEIGGI